MQIGRSHASQAYLDVLAALLLGQNSRSRADILRVVEEQQMLLAMESADASEMLANAVGDLDID